MQGPRHLRVGSGAAAAYRLREIRMRGDPVVDGPCADAEEAGQMRIGGAQAAVVAGQRAMAGAIQRGTSDNAHDAER
jgi:hypothetical protein